MSRSGEVTIAFGPEERTFRLGIEQWRRVQEKCDAGPPELVRRLSPAAHLALAIRGRADAPELMAHALTNGQLGAWRVDDVREPILQGLIGAGMSPTEAGILVRSEIDNRAGAWFEHIAVAYQIVLEGFLSPEDEPIVGEKKAAKTRKSRSRAAKSASRPSTRQEPSSGSARERLTA